MKLILEHFTLRSCSYCKCVVSVASFGWWPNRTKSNNNAQHHKIVLPSKQPFRERENKSNRKKKKKGKEIRRKAHFLLQQIVVCCVGLWFIAYFFFFLICVANNFICFHNPAIEEKNERKSTGKSNKMWNGRAIEANRRGKKATNVLF